MRLVCHVVDRMYDRRVRFKCATAVILCAVRAAHVRLRSQRARVSSLGKLRHLASVSLTCMLSYVVTSLVATEYGVNDTWLNCPNPPCHGVGWDSTRGTSGQC